MRTGAVGLLLFTGSMYGQTQTGSAATRGSCSPANTGDRNVFNITCGIGKEQGDKMLGILNQILASQLDPTAVMAKLDELKKEMDKIKGQGLVTNNCPNGLCVSGGVVDHPVVNNTTNNYQPPPPRITWSKEEVEGISDKGPSQAPDDVHPGVKVSITVASRFQFPMFAVRCDRPCAATNIGVEGASSPRVYVTNRPDVAVAGFGGMPAQIEAGTVVWVTVRSKDEAKIAVLDASTFVPPQ
jgi:hypothetical protein